MLTISRARKPPPEDRSAWQSSASANRLISMRYTFRKVSLCCASACPMRFYSGEARAAAEPSTVRPRNARSVPLPTQSIRLDRMAARSACKSVQIGVDYTPMLCQKCGLNEATVHRESAVFRQKIEEHLCELCAGVGDSISSATLSGKPVSRQASPGGAKRFGRSLWDLSIKNKHGNVLESPPTMVDIPKRVEVPRGLSAIMGAVERLFASNENSSALFISTLPGQTPCHLSLRREAEAARWAIMFTHHSPPDAEPKVRKFFTARGIPWQREIGQVTPRQFRHLLYPVSGRNADVAALAAELLKTCFSVQESDSLNFRFIRA